MLSEEQRKDFDRAWKDFVRGSWPGTDAEKERAVDEDRLTYHKEVFQKGYEAATAALESRLAALMVRVGVLEDLIRKHRVSHAWRCNIVVRDREGKCDCGLDDLLALSDPDCAALVAVLKAAVKRRAYECGEYVDPLDLGELVYDEDHAVDALPPAVKALIGGGG